MSGDIRLESLPFEYEGKTYILRCNMNVLADVQDAYNGDLGAALDEKRPVTSVMEFLAAMMNDYADEQHWPERFTARQLGRRLMKKDVPDDIMTLVISALVPDKTDTKPAANAGN